MNWGKIGKVQNNIHIFTCHRFLFFLISLLLHPSPAHLFLLSFLKTGSYERLLKYIAFLFFKGNKTNVQYAKAPNI